jgi:hypothetical protein
MTRLGLIVCVVGLACGGDPTPPTKPSSDQPIGPLAVAASHAAPTCPFAALGSGSADDDAPVDGTNGEDRRAKPEHGDRCEIADSNLDRVEKAIASTPNANAPTATKPWDHHATPQFDALVDGRFHLSADERARLARNSFVVPARLELGTYARAFHEIYQSELPVYISIDAVLDAIYAGNDSLIADVEDKQLVPALVQLLDALACALPAAAASYPKETVRDLDIYLAVARALVRGDAPASMFGDASVEAEASALVKRATDAQEMSKLALFGRERMIDFTAYTPRSHYAATDRRKRYFRAGMWLSRLELNLVSRSSRSSQPGDTPDPSETPREDVDALALADLVGRANQDAALAKLDRAWALFAGRREDVSIAQLAQLRTQANIASLTDPDAATKLRAAIGDKFQRTARLHYMPEGSKTLPAIATLLGPRVVPDAAATRPLVQGEIPDRENLGAADMAYALGHDHARDYLADDRAKFPTLDRQLDVARGIVQHAPRGSDDMYSAWLDAIADLAQTPAGARPSFTASPAYADLRINSALAAFGQLKHNFVLVAGESYFEGGCEIPDGYVEPAPATYDALLDYAKRGESAMAELDADGSLGARAYFQRIAKILGVLRTIQTDELAARPLTGDERSFLSMIAEMQPGTTGNPPSYTGWWFDMFRGRETDGLAAPDFIASYFTGGQIAYLGATSPRIGIFVVDTGGAPRLAVGPVARAYEYHGEVQHRLDDAAGKALADAKRVAPWAASYTVAAPPEPDIYIHWMPGDDKPIAVRATSDVGKVTIELYDHHRHALQKMTKHVKNGTTVFELHVKEDGDTGLIHMRGNKTAIEGLHVQVGEYHAWFDLSVVEPMVEIGLGKLAEAPMSDDDGSGSN